MDVEVDEAGYHITAVQHGLEPAGGGGFLPHPTVVGVAGGNHRRDGAEVIDGEESVRWKISIVPSEGA